jgi:hypothetical protein
MAQLSRVPPPTSPFNGRWSGLAAVAAAALIVAILKPWAEPGTAPASRSSASPAAAASPDVGAARVARAPITRTYEPSMFGPAPPEPGWEVWAAAPLVRAGFSGPPEAPGVGAAANAPESTPLIGGPVIDLGSADELAVLGLNVPVGTAIASVRLWRFSDEGQPRRVELTELAAPWPVDHFRVFGVRRPGLDQDTVLAWQPGLYRLDLLVDPADRIRSLMLTVGQGTGPPDSLAVDPPAEPVAALDEHLLRRLPDEANLWAFGRLLTGWARPSAAGTCRVAEMWRAIERADRCRPLPIGSTSAIGVNLPASMSVASIRLVAVDPLPGALDLESPAPLRGGPGLAMIEAPSDGFPDGIYRLDVRLVSGHTLHWYVEVSPGSRKAGEITAGRRGDT